MTALIYIIATIFILYWCITRLAAWFLSILCVKYFHVDVKIGQIGLFRLRNIKLLFKNGTNIVIDSIWLSSSFVNHEYSKVLAICAGDIRIETTLQERRATSKDHETYSQTKSNKSFISLISSILHCVCIRACNVDIILLKALFKDCLVHITIGDTFFDCTAERSSVEVSINVMSAGGKILKSVDEEVENTRQPCMAEIAFNSTLCIEAKLLEKHVKLKKLTFKITRPELTLNQGFSSLFRESDDKTVSDDKIISKSHPVTSTIEENFQIIHVVVEKLPENINFQVSGMVVRFIRTGGHRALSCDVKKMEMGIQMDQWENIDNKFRLPPSSATLSIIDVTLGTSTVSKLVNLQSIQTKLIIEECVIDLAAHFNSFHLQCTYEEAKQWLSCIPKSQPKPSQPKMIPNETPRKVRLIKYLLVKHRLKNVIELCDISLAAQLPLCLPLVTGFHHLKFTLDVSQETVSSTVSDFISDSCDVRMEILLETLWCKLYDQKLPYDQLSGKFHYWNTPAFLKVFLLKVRQQNGDVKIHAMIDTIQIEWRPQLPIVMLSLLSCLPKPSTPPAVQADKRKSFITNLTKNISGVQLNITGINLFASGHESVCLMLRVDTGSIEAHDQKAFMNIEGTSLACISAVEQSPFCFCSKSTEQKASIGHFKTIMLNYKEYKDINVQLLEHTTLSWSTFSHMTFINLIQQISEFKSKSRALFSSSSESVCKESSSPSTINIHVRVRGNLILVGEMGKDHKITVECGELITTLQQPHVTIQTEYMTISCDEHEIFQIQGASISKVEEHEQLRLQRDGFDILSQKSNKSWVVNFNVFNVFFPHGYNFADIYEKFMNIFKWLKMLHRKAKRPFTADSPLPADLLLKVKEFQLQINDDPFEVKLRDNYELLEDEFHESLKRKQMLDTKIEELRTTHFLLPAGKVEELYTSLQRKNAEIYIQRSRQMYRKNPMRTRLFVWKMDAVEIVALADPEFHGKENTVRHMKDIDKESPYPEEGQEYITLWCRMVSVRCKQWIFNLRDYPQSLMDIKELFLWGRLVGAEQEANKRAKRTGIVEIPFWGDAIVERSMLPLKYYHDFSSDVENFMIAYGQCWEPAITHINLALDLINRASVDPSMPLPFWDKQRLLLHGSLTMGIQQLNMILHASLDPYNTTEEMEWTWNDLILGWTNAKWIFKGDLDVYVRTESKYDDCRLLHLHDLKLIIKLDWLCLVDANDHHSVTPCAPDKVPEYSMNQVHDSYRAFRSQNLNLSLTIETRSKSSEVPSVLLYASTLRWFENLKVILSGVTRPTRRGVLFNNTKPRKRPLSRHYKSIHLIVNLHQFQVCYWMSSAKQRGWELKGNQLSLSSEYNLNILPAEGNLIHRPNALWSIIYMNWELNDVEIWLQSYSDLMEEELNVSLRAPVEKSFCSSVSRLSYNRETDCNNECLNQFTPKHRLVVQDLKAAWTKKNRNIVFGLFDGYRKAQVLKRNLSTEALKSIKLDGSHTPMKNRSLSVVSINSGSVPISSPSPMTRLQTNPAASMLHKLIEETESNFVAFSEETSGGSIEQLHGVTACQTDDVLYKNWLIELINSQVLLKGYETNGYVILSAAKAQVWQRTHRPVWRGRQLCNKTTWVGLLECMQYYATVDPGELSPTLENIMWVTEDYIKARDNSDVTDVPDLVGSGQGVGGVVSNTVGATSPKAGGSSIQLQRIISRCGCQFFYASYGENVDPSSLEEVPPPPPEDSELWDKDEGVDSFTLTHHDLNICSNSLQYAMILDIVNNLLLYVEPEKKEASERQQRMRFQLQLSSLEDHKKPILQIQNQVRRLVSKIRRLEKEVHAAQKALEDNCNSESLMALNDKLEKEVYECKEQLNVSNEELTIMINCFKERLLHSQAQLTTRKDQQVKVVRRNEVYFKLAQWRMTEPDGQLGIADLVLRNFLYSKVSRNDDSGDHLLELGYAKVINLLPNQVYKDALQPQDISGQGMDRQLFLRVICREKAPVGGISIKSHFEINVIPITLQVTHQFFNTVMDFFFPGRNIENAEEQDDESEPGSSKLRRKVVQKPMQEIDDLEKMKKRAEQNNMFLYLKIPAVPLHVSYKGEKEKNIEDVHDFNLMVPTLEYHNCTWTWLDLLLAIKNDMKKVLLSQAIKQKLQIKASRSEDLSQGEVRKETDKARLLLGAKAIGVPDKPTKKSIFKSSK